MEGNWVARVDWEAAADGHDNPPLELVAGEGHDSDVTRIATGDYSVILAGALFESGDRSSQAGRLLESYRRRGRESLSGLRGRFAALIWNPVDRCLTALRDPMGTYPLFFGWSRRKLFLSPGIESLLDLEQMSTSINRVALAEHLWHRWSDKQQTYFEALRRIPAGHALEATEDQESLIRYWDPASAGDPDRVDWLEPDELGRFGELFERAVGRFAGAERMGVFLSGGLDSVSIAGCLADRGGGRTRPLALSLAFDHPSCDELAIQTRAAAVLGFEHEIQRVTPRPAGAGPLERAADLASGWPAPLMNVWNGEFFRLALTGRQRGCDVILTGSGGDDWLGVSPFYGADLLLSGRLIALARLVGGLHRSYGLSKFSAVHIAAWKFGIRALLGGGARTLLNRLAPQFARRVWRRRAAHSMPNWLAPDENLRRELCERAAPSCSRRLGESFYIGEMRRGLDHPLIALELEESFELGRRLGVKLVHPFLDADLVEFLYRVSPRVLVGDGGPDRKLIRDRLVKRFPDLGFESLRKSDARAFFGDLARIDGARLWQELGGATKLQKLGIVDSRQVALETTMILNNASGANAFRLWDLINVERWLRQRSS